MAKILDHGYINLVEAWGSDERIIESARMSTDGSARGWGPLPCKRCGVPKVEAVGNCPENRRNPKANEDGLLECPNGPHEFRSGDEKLLRYLWENKHATPFEMAGMTVEVKAPIFVFRQWHRHRTQSYNEMSARYTPIPDEHYLPSVERLMVDGGKNKQAGSVGRKERLTVGEAEGFRHVLEHNYQEREKEYRHALSEGVPKELARLLMPMARYSKMRASANLRNWLGFLTLRMDSHAQWEIRQYANAAGALIAEAFPRTWALFKEGL